MTYIKVFRNKDLAPKRALKRLWGSFEGRLGRRTPVETAPIRISIIARNGLAVNDFCGWFVMKKGRDQVAVVSEKPHAAGGRGIPPFKKRRVGHPARPVRRSHSPASLSASNASANHTLQS